ncbi:MAG TPA: DedA family protein [Gammaproteobacteria bacterium]|nr:DedA family protein [Gammaproteobacteria bacterium]
MIDYFHGLLDWITAHPEYAGLVIFGMSLAESLAIVGMLVPGVVILFGAGTLIGAGVLDFWSSCAWAVAGAILGDGLSYLLGRHFDYLTERWRWFRLHPDHLRKGHEFFKEWGDISVALGRFFGPIRAIVPLVAGLMDMPPKRFYVANVLSALAWAPAYLLPGMLVGQAAEDGDWTRVMVLGAALGAVLLVLFLVRKRL